MSGTLKVLASFGGGGEVFCVWKDSIEWENGAEKEGLLEGMNEKP